MDGAKRNLTKEEKWLDGQSLKDFGLEFKKRIENKINSSIDTTVSNLDGKGLLLNELKKLDIVSETEGIIVNENGIKLNIVDDLVTGGVNRPLSAEQGKILKQLIDTLGSGGASKLLRNAKALGEKDYIGSLTANSKSIAVGQRLYNPTLYLDGTRIDKNSYGVELETGLITLNEIYADYDVTWVVEDKYPYHIKFSYPTLNLLINDTEMKKNISIGDVIEIQGESDADDGGHRLVKCENSSKLNGVDIGEGRFLNEIPNTRGANKLDKGTYSGTAQDLKDEIDGKINSNNGVFDGTLKGHTLRLSGDMVFKLITEGGWARGQDMYIDNSGTAVSSLGFYGYASTLNYTYLGGSYSDPNIKVLPNGEAYIKATNLNTNSKEVIGAVNEVFNNCDIVRPLFKDNLDGTFKDFSSKVKQGVYRVTPDTPLNPTILGIPSYSYQWGHLSVSYDDQVGCKLTYVADFNKNVFEFYRYNFKNSSDSFQTFMWNEVYNTATVQTWKSEDGTQGWVKYPDGRLEQWSTEVSEDILAGAEKKIVFPTSFTKVPYISLTVLGGISASIISTQLPYFVFTPKENIRWYSWVARGYWK